LKKQSIVKKVIISSLLGGIIIVLSTTFILFNIYMEKAKNKEINKLNTEITLLQKTGNNLNTITQLKILLESDEYIDKISILGTKKKYFYNNKTDVHFFSVIKTINKDKVEIFYSKNVELNTIKQLAFRMTFVTIAFLLLVTFITKQISKLLKPFNKVVNHLEDLDINNPILLNLEDNKITQEFTVLQSALNKIINKLTAYSSKINYMVNHDYLTKLNNRFHLDNILLSKTKNNKEFSILFLDIDNFKNINDEYGHSIGDDLLVEFSKILGNFTDIKDVFRIGGDEFIILLNYSNKNQISLFINNILTYLSNNKVHLPNNSFHIGISVGVSINTNNKTKEDILLEADLAMYDVKNKSKNGFSFFEKYMLEEVKNRNKLEEEIKIGLENKEFLLHFQPQYDVKKNKITGLEALVRWKQQDSLKYPDYFIDFLENSKYMIPVGYLIIEQSCEAIKEIKNNPNLNDIKRVSINISSKQFIHKDFYDNFVDILKKTNCKPTWIDLEITERVILNNVELVCGIMDKFKNLGITISIDDFGTGYSSLSMLEKLSIDTLKIDKSFIDNVESGIVEFIINLADKLNFNVVAEGVEELSQLKHLTSLNCDIIQGYYISKPLPFEDLVIKIEDINNPSISKVC